ncbi:MAG: dienelactone hydrolase family protein [Planctomycetia bacterium]|nr:dienelactone hydrolase family protein [Planctomycetia bacterium]
MHCPRIMVLLLASILLPSMLFAQEQLPGTDPLNLPPGTVSVNLLAGQLQQVNNYFLGRIGDARDSRLETWNPDFGSLAAYDASLAGQRTAVGDMLGLVGTTTALDNVTIALLGQSADCRIERIEVPTVDGVTARGLLFSPTAGTTHPAVVVSPDATTWPEQFTGLATGLTTPAWLSNLVARGASVYVPQSIERLSDHSYCTQINKDRRHALYRLGYVVGNSMPGLDVGDVSTAIDYLASRSDIDPERIGLAGVGQGGMTSLYTAAIDDRVSAVAVADYFQVRDGAWQESVDRRLQGQLVNAGDGELAALVASHASLDIVRSPTSSIPLSSVTTEAQRAAWFYDGLGRSNQLRVVTDLGGVDAVTKSTSLVADRLGLPTAGGTPVWPTATVTSTAALATRNQHFQERLDYLRTSIDNSQARRYARWDILNHSPQEFFDTIQPAMLADYKKLVGEVAIDETPLAPRSKLVLTTDRYKEYQVMLGVTEGVELFAHVLVPEGLTGPAPAIVAQHGFGGTPEMITGYNMTEDTVYHEFGRRLAEDGYVVIAPYLMHQTPAEVVNAQSLKASTVDMMRESMVVADTERAVDFLQTLPFVDPERIGYYGLSYGGYSAIWTAPLVDRLKAVVISGNFNDWREKITHDAAPSYLVYPDEDFYNWDVLDRFTHPELIAMTAPRAVCIEYGTQDGITTPEWTANAWSQVVALRDHLGLTNIELAPFVGPHEVHGVESFQFLDRILRPDLAPPETGLIGRWDLNKVVGGTTPGVVGPQDGQIHGTMTLAAGGAPAIYLPDGTEILNDHHFVCGGQVGDNINLGSDSDLSPRCITVAFWAKATGDHTSEILVSKHGTGGSSWEFAVGLNSNMFFRTFTGTGQAFAGSNAADPFTQADFNDGQWHLLVGTHDGALSSLYVDGELVQTLALAGSLNDTSGVTDLLLGQRPYTGVEVPYDGWLGGPLLIFDYALTAEEVAALLVAPLAGDANRDGIVDDADACILAAHWQTQTGMDWSDGDFNRDGKITDADAAILAAHWLQTAPGYVPPSVPEPSVVVLALGGVVCLLLRRRLFGVR